MILKKKNCTHAHAHTHAHPHAHTDVLVSRDAGTWDAATSGITTWDIATGSEDEGLGESIITIP
jgi:hypothetical protein